MCVCVCCVRGGGGGVPFGMNPGIEYALSLWKYNRDLAKSGKEPLSEAKSL